MFESLFPMDRRVPAKYFSYQGDIGLALDWVVLGSGLKTSSDLEPIISNTFSVSSRMVNNIVLGSSEKVVQTDDIVTLVNQTLAEMGIEETGATSDKDVFSQMHYLSSTIRDRYRNRR
jgi:hypothetical protein